MENKSFKLPVNKDSYFYAFWMLIIIYLINNKNSFFDGLRDGFALIYN